MKIDDIISSVRSTIKGWDRVLKLSKKPRRGEFITITKVTGLGTIVVGAIGFLIRMIVQIIQRLNTPA
jgi:protein transport protein SEC61 subunit gamma-like protein